MGESTRCPLTVIPAASIPIRSLRSKSSTSKLPSSARRYAAVSPASPVPTMATRRRFRLC